MSPIARAAGQVLWNHGGSADDLYQPGVATLLAPASAYFHGVVDQAVARGIGRIVLAHAAGPCARAVAEGARAHARSHQLLVGSVSAADLAGLNLGDAAVLIAGPFEHDVAAIRDLRSRKQAVALVAAVAAGITAFGAELGAAADGVLGPVQWWPDRAPEHGPSGTSFACTFAERAGRQPSYVAAQAASAGYLAHGAHQQQLAAADLTDWRTSSTLGAFQLDTGWRQVGHRPATVQWINGDMDRVGLG